MPYPRNSEKMKNFLRQLMLFIVRGMHCLSLVDNPYFIAFVRYLDPRITLPHKHLPVMYNEAVNKKYEGFEYAIYQKAMIRGLQGSQLDKVVGLESLVERYPDSRYTDEALLELGNTYLEMGKLSEATVPLRKLVSDFRGKSPFVNQALMQLGIIFFRQGNYNAAANYYKQVFSNNPEASEAKDALSLLKETMSYSPLVPGRL